MSKVLENLKLSWKKCILPPLLSGLLVKSLCAYTSVVTLSSMGNIEHSTSLLLGCAAPHMMLPANQSCMSPQTSPATQCFHLTFLLDLETFQTPVRISFSKEVPRDKTSNFQMKSVASIGLRV